MFISGAAVADSNFDIWRLQAQADIRGLIEAVKSGTPDIRKRAATSLRALGASSAIPALQAALVTEQDNAVRATLIATLDYLFAQEIDDDSEQSAEQHNRVVQLISQLNSGGPEQIIRAAQELGRIKEKIAAEALVMVFHNRALPGNARLAAAEALIKLESAPVEVTLLAALRNPDWHVRRNAAAVLGQLGADWAVAPLAVALRDEYEIIRRTAYAALKRIDTPEARRAIEPPAVDSHKAQTRKLTPKSTAELQRLKPPTLPETPAQEMPTVQAATPAPEPVKPAAPVTPPVQAAASIEPPAPPVAPPAVAEQPAVISLANLPLPDDDDTQPSRPDELPDDVG